MSDPEILSVPPGRRAMEFSLKFVPIISLDADRFRNATGEYMGTP